MEEKELDFGFDTNVIVRVKRVKKDVIEKVPLEDYITGVVAGEMPVTFHIEALKAQAVAARTYVLKKIIYNADKEYDVVDTVDNQVYLDNDYLINTWKDEYVTKINKIRKAVSDTRKQYMTYEGEIIDALYFSTSNGFTENSEEVFAMELPYLRSVESIWDKDTSPVFNATSDMNINEFYERLNLPYQEELKIEILNTTSTGRIIDLKINDKYFEASNVRKKLKIRSTDFKITKDGDIVYIKTKGFGHGVGMSQYGAHGMAEAGYIYSDILKHYYQNILIESL
jgi:stage II sporulation protein D